jgi:hypothetical protein
MKVDKKLELSRLLTMQSKQLNELLDKFEGKIPDLVAGASVDDKLTFYKKVNTIYVNKLNKLEETMRSS